MSSTGARRPSTPAALGFALSSLPIGIVGFTGVIALVSAGVPTMITWVGLPITAAAMLFWRGLATLERARVGALLGTPIDLPYRVLPDGWVARWRARLADGATWRDLAYVLLLFPIAIVEFVLVTTVWSVGLAGVALPIYFRYLPGGGYSFPDYSLQWIVVDSTLEALPWALLGLLIIAGAAVLTRGLGVLHAHLARALLGPRRAPAAPDSAPVPATLVAG